MQFKPQVWNAALLLQNDRSDEEVERLTGLDLLKIIELRAIAAVSADGLQAHR